MKSLTWTISLALVLLWPAVTYAQELEVLNANSYRVVSDIRIPQVYQGEMVILKLENASPEDRLTVFGQKAMFSSEGLAFAGIKVNQEAGDYLEGGIYLNDVPFRIEILEKIRETGITKGYMLGAKSEKRDRELLIIKEAYESVDLSENYLNGPFAMPLDIDIVSPDAITSPFGQKRFRNAFEITGHKRIKRGKKRITVPVMKRRSKEDYIYYHPGTDLKTKDEKGFWKKPVYAIQSGRVVLAARNFYPEGNFIILYHGLGIFSVYLHLDTYNVQIGEVAKKRQLIGVSGNSGSAKHGGPHLHFVVKIGNIYDSENRQSGVNVDPLNFIDIMNRYLNKGHQ